MTVWILTLVRPYLVCPGSMLIGHPRSWWRQQRSAPLYPPMLLALSTRHPFPHQAVPGILIASCGLCSMLDPLGMCLIGLGGSVLLSLFLISSLARILLIGGSSSLLLASCLVSVLGLILMLLAADKVR